MIKAILDLLQYAHGETENIRIAQGKYQLPLSVKEAIINQSKTESMERIELDLVANTGEAQKNIDQLTESVKEFNEERQKANDLDDDSIRITSEQNKIIRLFDQATGGAVTRVKSFM
jgi:hypothetical protein